MGSIGIISLTTRRNRRFFISAEHYPVVKVRPTGVDPRRSMRTSIVAQRSAGRWPAGGRQDTDQRLDGGSGADPSGDVLIDSFLPNTIQLLRCGPTEVGPPDGSTRGSIVVQRSAGRWPPADGRTRIRGSMAARRAGRGSCVCLGWSRDLRCCGAGAAVVETRRLELLTLSLQRRRSAN